MGIMLIFNKDMIKISNRIELFMYCGLKLNIYHSVNW